jgi:hypothetical protein
MVAVSSEPIRTMVKGSTLTYCFIVCSPLLRRP